MKVFSYVLEVSMPAQPFARSLSRPSLYRYLFVFSFLVPSQHLLAEPNCPQEERLLQRAEQIYENSVKRSERFAGLLDRVADRCTRKAEQVASRTQRKRDRLNARIAKLQEKITRLQENCEPGAASGPCRRAERLGARIEKIRSRLAQFDVDNHPAVARCQKRVEFQQERYDATLAEQAEKEAALGEAAQALADCQSSVTPNPGVTPSLQTVFLDFEDELGGEQKRSGESFEGDGFEIQIGNFLASNGQNTSASSSSYARVTQWSGNLAQMNSKVFYPGNVISYFDFGGDTRYISFDFFDGGGNINVILNGQRLNFEQLSETDGWQVGTAVIQIDSLSSQGSLEWGRFSVEGEIHEFAIGGQELIIDDLNANVLR